MGQGRYIKYALILSYITIFYNLIEGVASTLFGAQDETLALFGFGVDSFAEVLSGIGIAHMIMRMKQTAIEEHDMFEIRALRLTGIALYLLATGLVVGSAISFITRSEPSTTMAGVIISTLSILTMYFLYSEKMKVGKKLNSDPIISDAKCTKTCFYLSFILLGSSVAYELFQIPYIDAIGSLGIAWYAWREGRESIEKSTTKRLTCSDDSC